MRIPEADLRNRDGVFAIAASLALALLPAVATAGPSGYDRTFEVAANPVEVGVHYRDPAPGATTLAGEGSVRTALPGEGQLTLRVPLVVGPAAHVGNTQVAASYCVADEGEWLPKVSVVGQVDLPTAVGARTTRPSVKAAATKKLRAGVIESVHVESELYSDTRNLALSYRTAIGTTLRLLPTTTGSMDFVTLRPSAASGAPRQDLAQFGLSHSLGPHTRVHMGVGGGLNSDSHSVRATLGLDLRF